MDEALRLLAEGGDDAKIIAGGQSLLPVLKLRLAAPELVIDLAKIDSLKGIRDDGDAIVIGAMTPHYEVVADPLVAEHASLLAKCVAKVADPQVRHRGTFGGACAHADPASDIPAPTLALDAEFVIAGPGGQRRVAAADFYTDLFTTAIGDDEILVEVRVPKYTGWGSAYEKFVRVAQQWAIAGVAATVRTDGGTIAEARIGLTNMGPTPVRARAAETSARRGRCGGRGRRGRAERHRRGHRTADRPQRRPGVPATPGVGPGPPGRAGGRRRVGRGTDGPDASLQRARPGRRGVGGVQRPGADWRRASRERRSPASRATTSPGR